MQLILTTDYGAMSREAARQIAVAVAAKPTAALCIATGNTPAGAYAELAELKKNGAFDSSSLKIFQLDEYLGLKDDDARTLWGWMQRVFVTPLSIPLQNVVRLNGDTTNAAETCRAFDNAVEKAGGFDLCILGLGLNGHLGFNEPPSEADSNSHELVLTEESMQSNSVYWGGRDQVPPRAMTAGMRQVLGAKNILLLVSGKSKQDILQKTMKGPITSMVPASFLQQHANVTVIADEDAAAV